jgi:hypothetical protein
MKKRTRQLIIAAVLLVLLASAFLIQGMVEKKRAEAEAAALEEKKAAIKDDYEFKRFIGFPTEEIVKIEMITPEERAVLEREGEDWKLTFPAYEVMQDAVNSAGNSIFGVGSSTVVEENVKDWSIYGINDQSSRTVITTNTGEKVTLVLGDKTPTGSGNYIRIDGQPEVYMAYSYSADNLRPKVDEWRVRDLPQVNPQAITYIKVEGERTIEMVPFYEYDDFTRQFSSLLMIQPYEEPSSTSSDRLGRYLEQMMVAPLEKIKFVNDYDSLASLGLDEKNAVKLTLRDQDNNSVSLLIGNPASDDLFVNPNEEPGRYKTPIGAKEEYYARFEGDDEVFTISGGWAALITADPFSLKDTFVRLVNIDDVDAWSFTYKGETWGGRIEREGEGDDVQETYFFNNFEAPEDDFKDIYQDILYIVYEGEVEDGPMKVAKMTPEVTLRYIGTKEHGGSTRADFFPYNDLYYAVSVDGNPINFLVGRYQIEDIVRNMRAVDF